MGNLAVQFISFDIACTDLSTILLIVGPICRLYRLSWVQSVGCFAYRRSSLSTVSLITCIVLSADCSLSIHFFDCIILSVLLFHPTFFFLRQSFRQLCRLQQASVQARASDGMHRRCLQNCPLCSVPSHSSNH